jgi:hypothetical protein
MLSRIGTSIVVVTDRVRGVGQDVGTNAIRAIDRIVVREAVAHPLICRPMLCRVCECADRVIVSSIGGSRSTIKNKWRVSLHECSVAFGVVLVPNARSVANSPHRLRTCWSFTKIRKGGVKIISHRYTEIVIMMPKASSGSLSRAVRLERPLERIVVYLPCALTACRAAFRSVAVWLGVIPIIVAHHISSTVNRVRVATEHARSVAVNSVILNKEEFFGSKPRIIGPCSIAILLSGATVGVCPNLT